MRGGPPGPPPVSSGLDLVEDLPESVGVANARKIGVRLEQSAVVESPRDGASEEVERLLFLPDQRVAAGDVVEIDGSVRAVLHGLLEARGRRRVLDVRLRDPAASTRRRRRDASST